MSSDEHSAPDAGPDAAPDVSPDAEELTGTARKQKTLQDKQEKYLKYRHTGDISKEFGRQIARGEDPRCTYPWNRLDIVLRDNRTKVCSDFPTRLPRFDWPSTEDFHKEDQMWNHPFMQKMRGGMGTPDAVPFCDICVRANKRASKNLAWREQARDDTRKVYQAIEADILRDSYRGTLNEVEHELNDMRFQKPEGQLVRLFTDTLEYSRRRIYKHRFLHLGRVLQMGLRTPLASPFLAEANTSFTAADFSSVKTEYVASVVARFGIETQKVVLDPAAFLPFEDNSFEGIWLDGRALFYCDRDALFAQVNRVLGPDGILHVQEGYGPGMLLRMILRDPFGNNGRMEVEDLLIKYGHPDLAEGARETSGIAATFHALFAGDMTDELREMRAALDASLARTLILAGLKHQGVGNFFTDAELRRSLRRHSLTIDTVQRARFVAVPTKDVTEEAIALLNGDNALLDTLGALAIDPQAPLSDIANYDGAVVFNAFANVSNRKGTTN